MMRRFYARPGAVEGDRVILRDREAHHLAVVLRMHAGDQVVVVGEAGREHVVELTAVGPMEVLGRVVQTRSGAMPTVELTLVQAVPKGPRMDDVIRMGTELGIHRFIPVHSRRAVAEGRGRTTRWRRIAVAASKQSRRGHVPVVDDPVLLADALAEVAASDLLLILWEGERTRTIGQVLKEAVAPHRVALVVGPEGGFEPAEVEQARSRGAHPVTLGPLVLRTETAGVVAAAMVLYELTLRRA